MSCSHVLLHRRQRRLEVKTRHWNTVCVLCLLCGCLLMAPRHLPCCYRNQRTIAVRLCAFGSRSGWCSERLGGCAFACSASVVSSIGDGFAAQAFRAAPPGRLGSKERGRAKIRADHIAQDNSVRGAEVVQVAVCRRHRDGASFGVERALLAAVLSLWAASASLRARL